MGVKENSENGSLKHTIKKTKIMASSPIASWQIEGEKSGSSDSSSFPGHQNHCGQ